MSAREAIHARIHGEGYCVPPCGLCVEVQDLLAEYAHELAEKIRRRYSLRYDMAGRITDTHRAADLIDPEVPDAHR